MSMEFMFILRRISFLGNWGERRDLNPQPLVPQTRALPLSYTHHYVLPARLERATYSLEGSCSILLSYGSIIWKYILNSFENQEILFFNILTIIKTYENQTLTIGWER